jgi:hypothetical protein
MARFFALRTLVPALALPLCAPLGAGCSDSPAPAETADAAVVVATDAAIDALPPPLPDAATPVALASVGIFQAIRVPLVENGVEVPATNRRAPVVAGRRALVRVAPRASSAAEVGRSISVQLAWNPGDGAAPIVASAPATLFAKASDQAPDGVLDFEIPAEAVTTRASYTLSITAGDAKLRFPATGDATVGAVDDQGTLKVVLVPVQFQGDGSGRISDTSAEQLARYRDRLSALYPATRIDLSVRPAPFPWSSPVSARGTGWDELLAAVTLLRQDDRVAPDVYYYGIFDPAPTYDAWCGNGCVLGLSNLPESVSDTVSRVSIGIGFSGLEAPVTFVHELGHAHGRYHAPCGGAGGPDANYPYPRGVIGVTGWDARFGSFFDATRATDMMGYCDPSWISDYTFGAIYTRMREIAQTPRAQIAPAKTFIYRDDGHVLHRLGSRLLAPMGGSKIPFNFSRVDGTWTMLSAHRVPFAEGSGGLVYLPAAASPDRGASIVLDGNRRTVD